jgi:outer membrane protein assembly factor BamB
VRSVIAIAAVLAAARATASAETIHGLVFDDANGDGKPSAGERGVAGAIVAFERLPAKKTEPPDLPRFATTDASGQFDLAVDPGARGIVWVRVPDGFRPGPAWARYDGRDVDVALRRLAAPIVGPVTFVVAADSHLSAKQTFFGERDLADVAAAATALDPPPAFFTILGDVTQGARDADFDVVDRALADLAVPFVPVPGNHDWYDDGDAWFRRYGPDNYSFDLGGVHFVVWNMAMTEDDIREYLGAELARGPRMPTVALTHAPPSERVVAALRELGVAYVLTGHAHSNRVVDHGGVVELNTEPLLMGGLDFTPAGYRVVTIAGGHLASAHRAVVDAPQLSIVAPSPAAGACAPSGGELVVSSAIDAGDLVVTARVNCATPIALRYDGGWTWRGELPALASGNHALVVDATSATGGDAHATTTIVTCGDRPPPPLAGADWPQLGGDPTHVNARAHEIAPPLVARWTRALGNHVVTAPPVIANGAVYAVTTDLGDGGAGGVVAIDLATGVERWRAAIAGAVRGGAAVLGGLVVVARVDGVVVALDADTGAERWRYELAPDAPPNARATFAGPAVDGGELVVGCQRELVALAATGAPLWSIVPVPEGEDSESLAVPAIGAGIALATFNRVLGGVTAFDRATGRALWRVDGYDATAVNASPVIAGDTAFVVDGRDVVRALDAFTGAERWRAELDPAGFAWGNATVGTPALWRGDADSPRGVLVVPTLYSDVVALDAATGIERWRRAGGPSALRATHYRGAREAGFAGSPVVTGDIAWLAGTDGALVAVDAATGAELWRVDVGAPLLAGPAVSGDWLVVASFDGVLHGYAVGSAVAPAPPPTRCDAPATSGGCCDADRRSPTGTIALVLAITAGLRRRRARSRP